MCSGPDQVGSLLLPHTAVTPGVGEEKLNWAEQNKPTEIEKSAAGKEGREEGEVKSKRINQEVFSSFIKASPVLPYCTVVENE